MANVITYQVEAEYAWEKYEAMVVGNLAVARRGESAEAVILEFTKLKSHREYANRQNRSGPLFQKWLATIDAGRVAPRDPDTGEPLLPSHLNPEPSPLFARLYEDEDDL